MNVSLFKVPNRYEMFSKTRNFKINMNELSFDITSIFSSSYDVSKTFSACNRNNLQLRVEMTLGESSGLWMSF